jgi:uncharacterized protein (UPF0210 family)
MIDTSKVIETIRMIESENLDIRTITMGISLRDCEDPERVCSSVNVATTKTGINMDAVRHMGEIIKETALLTKDRNSVGCAKLVVFANAVEDNPFMAGAFHGLGEPECSINVGISGPGVVLAALKKIKDASFDDAAETVKRTAFKSQGSVSWWLTRPRDE